jgi:DMSO/TMAO reductase YedYZ molybdopterin-dependent catalytic subunit
MTLLCPLLLFGQSSPSLPSAVDVLLRVGGEIEQPLTLSASDFGKLPRREVRATDRDGKESAFEGVALIDILRLAGVPLGEKLRGDRLMTYLVVEAADGYHVVFALPELDPVFTEHVVLLADRRDHQPLSDNEGPLRLVVPHEKRHARWVRQVMALTIRHA